MLTLEILGEEQWDQSKNKFVYPDRQTIELEHSLAALSKWESIYEKPFLDDTQKSEEEIFGYIKAMVITPNVSLEVLKGLSQANVEAINDYLSSKQSATWFYDPPSDIKRTNGEKTTSELIYFWMMNFGIDKSCEHWHLNRLMTLIKIANVKNGKPQKRSAAEIAAERRAINDRRRKELGTDG